MKSDYYVDGQLLQETKAERDLGIIISDSGKVRPPAASEVAYLKANRMLGLIKRSVKYRHTSRSVQLIHICT